MVIRKATFVTADGRRVADWQNTESDFPMCSDKVVHPRGGKPRTVELI